MMAISVILSRRYIPPVVSISTMAYFLFFIFTRTRGLFFSLFLVLTFMQSCTGQIANEGSSFADHNPDANVLPGAYQFEDYLPMLEGKNVGAVVNHTSMVNGTHLVDTLLSLGVSLKFIFAPVHGFKGTAYNGEEVKDGVYRESVPIRSLYGKSRKPSPEDMSELDVVLFDIQDVGARFYTYISTLHNVMESAAQNDVKVMILDRPNPNGHYIDGPVLEEEFQSFVGMHPVPVVYGMTIGEYGRMINGEKWLVDQIQCDLKVIGLDGYTHQTYYSLPITPSPNLPNDRAIFLYPSLCFLEGTIMNEGRGTNKQFQIFGHPDYPGDEFSYTPRSMSSSKYPKHEGKRCTGVDLTSLSPQQIFDQRRLDLSYVISAFRMMKGQTDDPFFLVNGWFDKLSGTTELRAMIESGKSEAQIRQSWQADLNHFKNIRSKYLLYP